MSDAEKVLIGASRVERALRNAGARGSGLRELCQSLGSRIPPKLNQDIRYIGYLRNQAAHQTDRFQTRPEELRKYQRICDEAIREIERLSKASRWQRSPGKLANWLQIRPREHRIGRVTVAFYLFLIILIFSLPFGAAIVFAQAGKILPAAGLMAFSMASLTVMQYKRLISFPVLIIILIALLAVIILVPGHGGLRPALFFLIILVGTWGLATTQG